MENNTQFFFIKAALAFIILLAIGASVSPQFVKATPERKICSLAEGLGQMRSRLDLYRARNAGTLPPSESFEVFSTAMMRATAKYAPCINRIPTNPFNNSNTVRFDGEAAGSGGAGWRLDTKIGLIQADNSLSSAAL